MDATLADNMDTLQGRIVRDYQLEAKERERAARHAAAVEEKAKAISSAGREAANDAFMAHVTKSGVTVLDPTSKEQVTPS